jgi:type VI secretion system FHA domain protein
MGSDQAEDPVDPLDALGLRKAPKGPPPPRVEDLARGSPLRSNLEMPRITPRPPPPEERPSVPPMQPVAAAIPSDYNPLAHTDFERVVPGPPPPAPPAPPPRRPPEVRSDLRRPAAQPLQPRKEVPPPRSTPRQPPPQAVPPPAVAQPKASPAPAAPSSLPPPPPPAGAPAASGPAAGRGQLDFAALLAAAGLQGVPITPDISASFGSILKVIVDGLRDVLRAREELKDQFRLRITSVAARENNPIKFSANTEDALHNLLVRHNPAYLEPVAAFEGAFDDLRIHQMAMLAGLRAGYEAMVKAFDPDILEQKFERYARRGGILGASAKPRFWDLYREVFEDTTGDPDECFRTLFGTAFSKAYEEQTRLLKQRSRGP